MPQGTSIAQHGTRAAIAHLSTPTSSQGSGLSFAPAVLYGSGGYRALQQEYPQLLAVADVNGDGKPDLMVANECGANKCAAGSNALGVLLGNGDGTFQPALTYYAGGVTSAVTVADVNGDGKPDIVVALFSGHGDVGVLLGNGDGTFQTVTTTYNSGGTGGVSMSVADVNEDGKLDVVVMNQCSTSTTCSSGSTAGVLLGNGDGTFQPVVTYAVGGSNAGSATVADVNGDTKLDIVVASSTGVDVLMGNGDGTFQTAVAYASGGLLPDAVTVADVNGDGKADLLVANFCVDNVCKQGSVGVLLGNGNGTFQTAVAYGSGEQRLYSVAVADVNGDGKPDVVVVNGCNNACNAGSAGVLLGNGDGTFQTAAIYNSGAPLSSSVAIADVNGDGKPDLLVANPCISDGNCGSGTISVLLNTSISGTTTALLSAPNPSQFGQTVTFTATVTPLSGFYKGTPTGTVSFLKGATNLGSSTLNGSGTATFTISTLAVGTSSITASYGGSTTFAASSSPALKQVVQGSIAQFSATSINFGNQTIGIAGAAHDVTLTNKGNIALTISSIGIIGTDHADFAETNNCGASVSAGGTCTISVTFKPAAVGTRTAAVSIADNATASPQSVSLTGVGVLPAVMFSPASLAFPTQIVFTTSAAETVKLTNSGLGILKITKVAVTGPFAQTNNCGSTVNPSASCTLTVTFKPTTTGTLTGSIAITDNAPNSPQNVTLSGTGTAVELTPTSVNFGNQPTGTKSLAKTITLTNQGHATVSITSMTITGADAGDFSQTNTCGTSVASGASCFIKVTFKPSATGMRTAAVSVSDNGGGSPQKVTLTGTGT